MKPRFLLTAILIGVILSNTTAQVLINEVMHYPSTAQGLVAGGTEMSNYLTPVLVRVRILVVI